jgi:hypothetical protein
MFGFSRDAGDLGISIDTFGCPGRSDTSRVIFLLSLRVKSWLGAAHQCPLIFTSLIQELLD